MCIRLINKKPSTNLTSPIITVPASGTVVLLENGEHDVREYAKAKVEVKQPSGTIEITENGIHNIADYAEANVNVVPDDVVDYWSTEQYTRTQNSGLNLLNYVKELPRYINISNYNRDLVFAYLPLLEKVDVREWDLSLVKSFSCHSCDRLKEVNMSGCDLTSVTQASSFMTSLVSLEKLFLKDLKINSSITSIAYACSGCNVLKYADLSGIELPNLTNINYAFRNCPKLEYLDIRDLDLSKTTSYSMAFTNIPTNCEIIVKDETSKKKVLSSNYNLTNVKTVAEIEGGVINVLHK
jgi:hypothetical protein